MPVRPDLGRRSATVLFSLIAAVLVVGAPVAAQDDAESISGVVILQFEDEGERRRDPLEGVRMLLESADGESLDETVTDAEGRYGFDVPGGGSFVVVVDEATLPDGVEPGDLGRRAVDVPENGRKVASFFFGEDLRDVKGKWELLPQTLVNGLKLSLLIAVASIGLSLIFATTGLSNFAHGEMVTFGAIMAWVFNSKLGFGVIAAALAAMLLGGAAGGLAEQQFWRRLRRRGTSLTTMMIISIGLALSIRYMFLFFIGGRARVYDQYGIQDPIEIGPIELTPRSIGIMTISLAVLIGVALFLLRARFGKAIRAVSDNRSLASATGINVDQVVLIVWAMGGSLAALGGVLYALEFQLRWDMGFILLLLMFAAITLGGLGNPFGALVGSLVVGMFVELWTWVVPNADDLKTVGALVALTIILVLRPQGILGRRERVG